MTTSNTIHRTVTLPAIGTPLPHLGGTFWGLQRAKPGSGLADYALIVPEGDRFELRDVAWGGYGKDEPGAACQWDGQANTTALLASEHNHPVVQLLRDADADLQGLYLPALRELKTLFANGCDQFDQYHWYWSSTQFSRSYALYQDFNHGYTNDNNKTWEGGCVRFIRRFPLG